MITKKVRNEIKRSIVKSLTDEKFGIFNKSSGHAIYNGTNLEMVMDRVYHGLRKCTGDDEEGENNA